MFMLIGLAINAIILVVVIGVYAKLDEVVQTVRFLAEQAAAAGDEAQAQDVTTAPQ